MQDADTLTPADPSDLAAALAYALRPQGGERVHNAYEIDAESLAKHLVATPAAGHGPTAAYPDQTVVALRAEIRALRRSRSRVTVSSSCS